MTFPDQLWMRFFVKVPNSQKFRRSESLNGPTCYLISFFAKSTTTGVAMQIDEYVPMIIPIRRANVNPRITSPPKMNMASNTKNIVSEVLIVRLSVALRASLITFSWSCAWWCMPTNSRILSNTTTVSVIEYPITVKMAAMNAWSISSENGSKPLKIEKTESRTYHCRRYQVFCSLGNLNFLCDDVYIHLHPIQEMAVRTWCRSRSCSWCTYRTFCLLYF